MLSQSRISQATKQFMDTLNQLSNEIVTYYFQSETPTQPYRIHRHLSELYTFVYENCTSKPNYEEKMFETYKSALLRHLIKYMEILNEGLRQEKVIHTYNLIWDSYKVYLRLLANRVFLYLSRYYVPANDHESLVKIGLNVFAKTFLADPNIKVFINPFIRELDKMRAKRIISNDQLLKFSESFVLLDSANLFPILRTIYMDEAAKYYKKMFEDHCNDEPMQYLNFVNNLRYFEAMLAKNCICLTESEEKSLWEFFNKELIKRHTHIFLCHPYGFTYLLRNYRTDHLKLVCQVYERNQGLAELKKFLLDFILEQGNVVLSQKSKQIGHEKFIDAFLDFFTSYHKVISLAFGKNSQMMVSINSAIEKLLIKFERVTDDLFKFVRLSLDARQFDDVKQKFVLIFEKLPYKDQFLNLYRSSLEKKIITESVIYATEKSFIEVVHQICNNQMTTDLVKILEDSIEPMPQDISSISQNFRVKVVHQHLWQKKFEDQIAMNLVLVQPLASTWLKFQQKYTAMFPKRKLNLLPYETKMVLRLTQAKGQLIFKCNLLQACMILYTARNPNKKVHELINDLSVEKIFIARILEQCPALLPVDAHDCVHLNWQFETTDAVVDLDSKVEQQKKVTKHVKQDREILLQCAIVRAAKKRKQLSFEDLVQEINHSVKIFKPHPSVIKLSIEALKKKDMVQEAQDGTILYKE